MYCQVIEISYNITIIQYIGFPYIFINAENLLITNISRIRNVVL